ncbi:DUF3494 domain-containing protein [Brumimicrobium glaciale]|uniref:DUF3494 domain-containing protein n=1 Tax=Brumimicrobium glaciale TaxID=200475 RepID=A0A4Q4KQL2_9FLAO|nr:ice-binding family protein [Brumimicrobium glaciale]RYM35443.1 DUF3494 domain-containing protein [Brumimicrobium glaciale]
MIRKSKNIILAIALLLTPAIMFGQTPIPLGVLSSFEAYAGIGAVTNSGTLKGDVGSHTGAITGCDGPPSFVGTVYHNDSTTLQAREDMLWMYINLNNLPVTNFSHPAAFGSGETLNPGVYSIPSAGSLAGTITLKGGANDFYVFKFEGAFTIGIGSTVILAGGLRPANVFWIANGAISATPTLASNRTSIKGTLFSYPGAITLGGNCDLEGRMLSTNGAISTGVNSVALRPLGVCTIPIPCLDPKKPVHDVLGTIDDFIFFTNNGAVTNVSTSGIVGSIGADNGSLSGFESSTHIRSFELGPINTVTNQAALDLNSAYTQLMAIPATVPSGTIPAHSPTFGLSAQPGEILIPGVYDVATAASLTGYLTLDGGGDPNAVFIIRINGAFTVTSRAKVILKNGTRASNVFWITTNAHAIAMGTWSSMRGTIIAGGACTMGASGNLEGRMLSRNGAVAFSTGTAYNEALCNISSNWTLPIELLSFTAVSKNAHLQLNWATASEVNNDYFTLERSPNGVWWETVKKVDGSGNSKHILDYSWNDNSPYTGISYYRLKQTDFDGKTETFNIVSVEQSEAEELQAYPNPVVHTVTLLGVNQDQQLRIFNTAGIDVTNSTNISLSPSKKTLLDMSHLSKGMYYVDNGEKPVQVIKL